MSTDPQISFEQPRSAFGTWLGVVLLFAVFGLFVWVVVGIMPRGNKYEEKRAEVRTEKLKVARDEANTALHGYTWADKEKGLARIPIQRAMELTVAELAQKKPAPAGPIAPAPGAAAPAPGQQAAATNAPVAAPAAAPSPAGSSSPAATSITGANSAAGGQPTSAINSPGAPPGTQPGPNATPAASAPAPSGQAPAPPGERGPTPVQTAPGTPLPVRGATPSP